LIKALKSQSKTISDGFQKWMSERESYQKTPGAPVTEAYRAAYRNHLENLGKVNDRVLAEYKLSRKDLERISIQANAAVAEAVQSFLGSDQTSIKREMLDHLKKARLLTPGDISLGDPRNNVGLNCGSDGLKASAFYVHDEPGPGVFLCPGFLLLSLEQADGDIGSLVGVLAHEIGHAIDGRSIPVLQPSGQIFRKDDYKTIYQPYWNCMSNLVKREGSKFISLGETMEYYSKNLPSLERSSKKNPDRSFELNEIIKMAKLYQHQASAFSVDPMSSELLKSELIADSYMGAALERVARDLDRPRREAFIVKNLKLLCIGPTPEGFPKKVEVLDPDHPPLEYRVEQTLMQPSVRALLGCPAVDAERRPCSLMESE
jgi:hypothetical protein